MAILNAEVQRVLTDKQITVDFVIAALDTSCVTALNLAHALGLPYLERYSVMCSSVSLPRMHCHMASQKERPTSVLIT
jgi:glutamine phosphoribosylpyrophosphate amidotransferase